MSKKKTVQTNDPWAPAQPFILKGLEQTSRVFDQVQPQTEKYGQMSFDTYGRMAPGAEGGILGSQNLVNDTLAGKYLNGNPYLDKIISKNAGDIRDSVGSAFSGAGRYGSGMFGDTLADNIGEMASNLRYGNYNQERQNQINAIGDAQGLMAGSQGLLEQAATLPWTGVQALNGGVRTASNGYGKQTTTQSGGLLDSAMALGGLGLKAYSTFSDARLKTDIKRVGTTEDGLGVYTYRYKGDPIAHMGVMAQEVAEIRPDALGPVIGGMLTVNYGVL